MRFVSVGTAFVLGTFLIIAGVGCTPKTVKAPPATVLSPSTQANPPLEVPAPPTVARRVDADALTPVFFTFDSFVLDRVARSALDRNAKLLRDHPDMRITIEGHCDERGTAEYNQALGERRAVTARDYLVAAGVSSDRVSVVSFGKEKPFDSGHGETSWSANRRAHFVVP